MTGGALDHPLVTTFGRLAEACAVLERDLGRELERGCGLPHTWFEALLRIARSPDGLTMGELGAQVVLSSSGVTRLLDRMVAAGLVERHRSTGDRRRARSTLTAAGRATLDRALQAHVASLERLFGGFTAGELETLDRMLDRLRHTGEER